MPSWEIFTLYYSTELHYTQILEFVVAVLAINADHSMVIYR
jgi:hypothetical protein